MYDFVDAQRRVNRFVGMVENRVDVICLETEGMVVLLPAYFPDQLAQHHELIKKMHDSVLLRAA
jgi:hypothetical protein